MIKNMLFHSLRLQRYIFFLNYSHRKDKLYSSFCPVAAIKISITYGLGDVDGLDFFRTGKIGNGTGDFENAAVGTGREF